MAEQQRFCIKCETLLEADMKFCRGCGAPVSQSGGLSSSAPSGGFTLTQVVANDPNSPTGSSGFIYAPEVSSGPLPDTEPVMPSQVMSARRPVVTSEFVNQRQPGTGSVARVKANPTRTIKRPRGKAYRYTVLATLLSALFVTVCGAGLLTYKFIFRPKPVQVVPAPITEVPVPTQTPAPEDANALLAAAKTDLSSGKLNEAIEKLDRAIQLDATNGENYKLRGNALLAASRYSEAGDSFREAIARNSSDVEAYRGLAQSFEQLGQDDQVIETYTALLVIKNDEASARIELARALARKNRLEEARRNYEQVAASGNAQLAAAARQEMSKLSDPNARVKPTKPVIAQVNNTQTPVVTTTPEPPPVVEPPKPEPPKPEPPKPEPPKEPTISADQRITRGTQLYNSGDLGGALKEYQQALKQQPGKVDVYYLIGLVYEKQGDLEAAMSAFERCQSGPYVGVARSHVEMIKKKLGKKQK